MNLSQRENGNDKMPIHNFALLVFSALNYCIYKSSQNQFFRKEALVFHGKRKQPRPYEPPAIPCCYSDSYSPSDETGCTKLPSCISSCFMWNLGWEAPSYRLFMKGEWEEWKTIGIRQCGTPLLLALCSVKWRNDRWGKIVCRIIKIACCK